MKTKTLRVLALAALLATPFALAAQQSLPYSYGFEEAAEMNNWTTQSMNTENAANMQRVTTQHHSGSYSFQFSAQSTAANGNYNQYLITPELNCPNGTFLEFYYKKQSQHANAYFRVGYSSTNANPTSFTWISNDTLPYSTVGDAWFRYAANLPAGTKYVAINYYHNSSSLVYNKFFVDDFILSAGSSCMPVTNLEVSVATQSSLTLSWTDTQNDDGVTYMVYDMSDTTLITDTVSGTTFTVTGLEPNTEYTFGVVADCGGGNYSTRVSTTGHTDCGMVGDDELPWGDDFNTYGSVGLTDIPCYQSLNYGYNGNLVYPGISTIPGTDGNTQNKAMVFKCRGTVQYQVAILPQFESIGNKTVVFNIKDNGVFNYATSETEYHGVVEVGVMSDPADQTTFTAIQTFTGLNATWAEKTVDLSSYTGTGLHIAFRCHNTMPNTSSSENPVYIDNLYVLESPSCPRLTGVTVDNITGNDATVHIGDTAAASHISYRITFTPDNGDDPIVITDIDTTNYTATGLTPNTAYTVSAEAECSDGSFTAPVTVSIRTGCGLIPEEAMPFSENFDSYQNNAQAAMPCWTILNAVGGYPKYASYRNHGNGSGNGLLWTGATSQNTLCVLPAFDVPLDQLIVNLWFYTTSSTDGIQLGYVTDNDNAGSYVALASYVGTAYAYSATGWSNVELTVPSVPAEASNLAIKFVGTGQTVVVDDIVVTVAPNCPQPTTVVVSDITNTSAHLHVADSNDSPNYTVRVYGGGNTLIDNVTYTTTEIPLTGLAASTVYTVEVVANCPDGGSYSPVTMQFSTQCTAIGENDLPWNENFDTYPGTSGSLESQYALNIACWTVACRYSGYYPFFNSAVHYNGSNSLYCYGTAAQPTVFALPWFDNNLSNLQLTFAVRRTDAQANIEVGVMSNPMDTNTFVHVQTCSPSTSGSWQMFTVTFASFTTGNIAFRSTSLVNIDAITVNTTSLCTAPVVTLCDTTTEGVTVTLNDVHNTAHYMLYLDGSAAGIEVNGNTYTIEGLAPGTIHSLTARTVCGAGSMSDNSPAVGFHTLCEPVSTPSWSEDFETWATGDSTYNPCWVSVTDGTTPTPYAENTNGNKSLYFLASSGAYNACYSMAKLPQFAAAVNTLTISFRYKVSINASDSRIIVGVAGEGNDTAGFTRIASFTPANTNWHEYDVDLAAYNGTNNRIAVMLVVSGDNRVAYGYMDDVEVYVTGDCLRPAPIVVSNVGADSVHLDWSAGSTLGDFSIKWTDEDSTTVYDQLGYTLESLQPYTTYTVTVRRECDGELSRPRTVTFTTHALPASLPYNTGFETTNDTLWNYAQAENNQWHIGNAVNNGGSRSLYISTDGGVSNTYVSDATHAYAYRILNLTESGNYDISFDWKAKGEPTTIDCDYLRAYIAPEANAPVTDITSIPSSWQSITDPLSMEEDWQSIYTVANVEAAGNYALIFCWKVDALTVTNPPAAIDNVIVARQSCTPPTDLTYGQATATTISFSWTAGSNETAWDVNINNSGWQRVSVTNYTATGLTPDTDNDIAVRAVCGDGGNSFAITGTMHTGTLGIADNDALIVAITPNPATNIVTVSAGAMHQAAIIDLNGRTVTTAPMTDGSATFDVSTLARGAYFVRITGDQATIVRKLIVR